MREEILGSFLIAGLVVLVVLFLARRQFTFQTVFDFQKGLLYRRGVFTQTLEPGRYFVLVPRDTIEIFDIRKTMLSIPGQEILTKDKINIKLSLSGHYSIADPLKTKQSSQYFISELYNDAQMLLRDKVSGVTLDELLEGRAAIDASLLEGMQDNADSLGLTLSALAIKDIILPANLKRAYAGVIEAQKEAQRQLEKARGEQAVLRSLANSSRMYDNNPSLMQARIVQSLAEGRNTVVFNADGTAVATSKAADPV
ncbi:MAG: slipin family protein [Hyphomicrobiales bacterium]|nr:slipin family protein [Hyphomicrobiales bacterium]